MPTPLPPDFPEEMLPKSTYLRATSAKRRPIWQFAILVTFTLVVTVILAIVGLNALVDWLGPISLPSGDVFALGVIAVTVTAHEILQRIHNRKAQKLYDECQKLAFDTEALTSQCKRAKSYPDVHTWILLRLGYAYVWHGNYESALSIFAGIYNSKRLAHSDAARHGDYLQLIFSISHCYWSLGKLDNAEFWQTHLQEAAPGKVEHAILLDTLIATRRGRFDAVIKDLQRDWGKAERSLDVISMKMLRLCLAFAIEQQGNGSTEESNKLIAGLHPVQLEDFKGLSTTWTEMSEFIRKHKLVPEIKS